MEFCERLSCFIWTFSNQVILSFIARANMYFVGMSLDFDHVLRKEGNEILYVVEHSVVSTLTKPV